MRIIVDISRILVGSLFIFSGIIKANDPLGFSYKLEEYWIEFGIAWDWLLAIGVPLASFICILEIVLGIAVLVGYRMKLVSWLLLLMIVFFSILTFASAVFGLVRTCGCFGDAIPLTPWQSFNKDVVLLILIVILFSYKSDIKPNEGWKKSILLFGIPLVLIGWASFQVDWLFPLLFTLLILAFGFIAFMLRQKKAAMFTVLLSFAGSLWICYYVLNHLPLRDFRPYAIGKNISDQMKLPEGAKEDVYENVFKYKNKITGKVEDFSESAYPWDDTNYVFVDRVTTLIEKGDEAKISDFSIISGDYDMTEDILMDPDPIVLIISYNISKANHSANAALKKFSEDCNANGISIIGLTATDKVLTEKYLNESGINVTFHATDENTLKTMIRSNPGIMLLHNGTVKGQWHFNDCPTSEEIKSLI